MRTTASEDDVTLMRSTACRCLHRPPAPQHERSGKTPIGRLLILLTVLGAALAITMALCVGLLLLGAWALSKLA